ncbi:MAG: hypothetical protein KKA19_01270, partial [Candidatus Margulisbacteria bacterium]|nr:hypothetical protein [Candidatus Margulisiibacteriota bacterium]
KLGSDRTEAQFLLRRDFELPIKYKLTTLLRVFLEKITEAKFMGTLFRQALEMLKHPSLVEYIIFQIIDRRTRKTYIKGITISKIDLHKKIYLGGRNSIGK